MTRPSDDSEPGRRPPDYVIVVAASDWVTDRYPAAAASLTQTLQPDQDRHRDPELLSGTVDTYGSGGFPALCAPMMLAAGPRGV